MKPRLETAPLSREDSLIWKRINNRFYDAHPDIFVGPSEHYMDSDRRDAALMWSMVGIAARYGYTTADRRQPLAYWFSDPFCGMLP